MTVKRRFYLPRRLCAGSTRKYSSTNALSLRPRHVYVPKTYSPRELLGKIPRFSCFVGCSIIVLLWQGRVLAKN
jgi:hypothetical protein